MAKPCTVNGCPRPLLARGWCATHYARWRNTGDPGGAELLRAPGNPGALEKACSSCGEIKEMGLFHKEKRNRDGRASQCKACYEKRQRRTRIVRKYGITQEDRDQMLAAQNGECAICHRPEPLVVDHCHRGGQVRALLCDRCNRLLGVADDDPALLTAAVQFLKEHTT